MDTRKEFYVYFHRDEDGNIFYVGKGTDRRAWSLDRHGTWTKYVSERLAGHYTVEIHASQLTESEAYELEDSLINQYGQQLINWANPGRHFDDAAIQTYHKLRDANRRFVADTKPWETRDPELAVVRYRQALAEMRHYEAMTLERGLVADMGVGPNWGDPNIIDRLTMCLIKLQRTQETIEAADQYFADFPSVLTLAVGKRLKARIDKLRNKRHGA